LIIATNCLLYQLLKKDKEKQIMAGKICGNCGEKIIGSYCLRPKCRAKLTETKRPITTIY
jgi:hypothetical protein